MVVATRQTANLCGKLLNLASLPRPQGRGGAPNLGDDSGKYEDLGTTENTEITEITERRIRRKRNTTEENEINVRLVDPEVQTVLDRRGCL